ncbi:hypothetical protein GCM10010381_30110 [Streptomyces xantholiticus]|nr:hypothetical protein GCM10010381_30110 [Streptomyces xantholiticus]
MRKPVDIAHMSAERVNMGMPPIPHFRDSGVSAALGHSLSNGQRWASCQQDAHLFHTPSTDFRNGTLMSRPKGFRAIPSRRKP